MNRGSLARQMVVGVTALALVFSTGAFSSEWKPRHPLLPPAGSPNLEAPYPPGEVLLPGPERAADSPRWLADIQQWRQDRLVRLRFDDSEYNRPELQWTQRVFTQAQILVWDRYFYDPVEREYTVDRLLDDLENRYGKIDAVLVWPTYPNLGVDDRNQHDLLRDLPGGLEAIRQVVADFHRRSVKVFFPAMAWDQGTRDEGVPPWTAMARLLGAIGADGINGDTLESVPRMFRMAADEAGHPLALEPQFDIRDESLAWNNLSWNDWVAWEDWQYPFLPMVSKTKWLETRHMVNICDRFTRDKIDSLQHAFFNGVGYVTLENLWGFWNQLTPRDAEALRRSTRIERTFASLLASREWEPHTPMLQYGVFASRFPSGSQTLWTIVNRNEYAVEGEQIQVLHRPGWRYYDLWHGVELRPAVSGSTATLSLEIEGLGFGAILATPEHPGSQELEELLRYMNERSRKPLGDYSREWKFLPQQIVEIEPTKAVKAAPPGMVRIPAAEFDFEVHGLAIEGGNDPGVDVQYAWEDSPRRHHRKRLHIRPFFIDRHPVTNADFKKFLDATGYHPRDDHNFLKHWKDGTYPEGWGSKPVTWVSIEDARAYAAWAGKRLPNEWEWQYAAQGTDGRVYPWGNDWDQSALPPADKGRTMREPTNVDAYAQGAGPFGVMDMVGNVLQWTNEFRDEHTRAAIARGGSSYQPQGSMWYFPQAYKLNEHHKYLLMAPSLDRSASIGFRCVVDAE